MMHVTALFKTPKDTTWRPVSYGTGSNLRWAAHSCFVATAGTGITYEEVKIEGKPKGEYDMEAHVTRKNPDGSVAAEWRIVPSPGSRPDPDAPKFVPQPPRPSVADTRANSKAHKPAVAAQAARRGVAVGTVVERAKTPEPAELPPIPSHASAGLVRRPIARRPLTRKSLDNAPPAPTVRGPLPRRRLTVSGQAQAGRTIVEYD